MSELVLYRKYRPKIFDEVVGQESIINALQNALRTNRVAHAYLFSGPRGVGKTTVARLMAKSVNCLKSDFKQKSDFDGVIPCNSCSSCDGFNEGKNFDLIEIDAASNRGIDEIRELRESVRFVPSQGKFKTYVIDECHMLTKEAFSALLKTLEEPPKHAIFVLATTELEKVPATIVSRTQHYDFRRPNAKQIAGRLLHVAGQEKVILADDAARLIAFVAEGSLRDAESILGQIMAVEDKKITREGVENVLGIPKREAAKKMFSLVAEKNTPASLALIQELHEGGHDMQYFSKLLLQYFRSALFLKIDPSLKEFVAADMLPDEYECIAANLNAFSREELSRAVNVIFENMLLLKRTPIPQLPLELTVAELTAPKDVR